MSYWKTLRRHLEDVSIYLLEKKRKTFTEDCVLDCFESSRRYHADNHRLLRKDIRKEMRRADYLICWLRNNTLHCRFHKENLIKLLRKRMNSCS